MTKKVDTMKVPDVNLKGHLIIAKGQRFTNKMLEDMGGLAVKYGTSTNTLVRIGVQLLIDMEASIAGQLLVQKLVKEDKEEWNGNG